MTLTPVPDPDELDANVIRGPWAPRALRDVTGEEIRNAPHVGISYEEILAEPAVRERVDMARRLRGRDVRDHGLPDVDETLAAYGCPSRDVNRWISFDEIHSAPPSAWRDISDALAPYDQAHPGMLTLTTAEPGPDAHEWITAATWERLALAGSPAAFQREFLRAPATYPAAPVCITWRDRAREAWKSLKRKAAYR